MSAHETSHILSFHNLNLLSKLKENRHALSPMPAVDFGALRLELLHALGASDDYGWHLVGSDGCHLCEEASSIIAIAAKSSNQMPKVSTLDLVDAVDDRLIDVLGRHIPILVSDRQLICYPFGLMDVVRLLPADDSFG